VSGSKKKEMAQQQMTYQAVTNYPFHHKSPHWHSFTYVHETHENLATFINTWSFHKLFEQQPAVDAN